MDIALAQEILVALVAEWPPGADFSGFTVTADDARLRVDVFTTTPGLAIGRRGVTANRLRSTLQEVVGATCR